MGETGTAQKIKKAKKNKKGEEQLTVEEEAELEKQKVSTKNSNLFGGIFFFKYKWN